MVGLDDLRGLFQPVILWFMCMYDRHILLQLLAQKFRFNVVESGKCEYLST